MLKGEMLASQRVDAQRGMGRRGGGGPLVLLLVLVGLALLTMSVS
jgi:hypothetical protein